MKSRSRRNFIALANCFKKCDEEPPAQPQRRRSSSLREPREKKDEETGSVNGINLDDRQDVLKGMYLFIANPPRI